VAGTRRRLLIGSTLLAIAAAVLAAEGDSSLASHTFLAAQVDFSEPGELSLSITPSQMAMLKAMMSKTGVLEKRAHGRGVRHAALG